LKENATLFLPWPTEIKAKSKSTLGFKRKGSYHNNLERLSF
jgi:hypothetical protein